MNRKHLLLLGGGVLLPMLAWGMEPPTQLPSRQAPRAAASAELPGSSGSSLHKVPSLVAGKDLPTNLTAYVPNREIPGVYTLPLNYNDEFELLYANPGFLSNYSTVEADGVYYGTYLDPDTYAVTITGVDSKTWEPVVKLTGTPGCCGIDTAYDPVTGRVYGCFMADDLQGVVFGYIDFSKGGNKVERTAIAPLDVVLYGVAIDAEGNVYGITNTGDLYSVDKTTGALTFIGETGLQDKYMTSATIDHKTGRMYYGVSDDGFGAMYEIDPATGYSTYLHQFPYNEEVIGLYAAKPLVEDEAPAAVSGVSYTFDKDSRKGTCTFTAPTRLYNGADASGALTYTVKGRIGEEASRVLATGSTTCGATVSCDIEVWDDAMVQLQVYVSNAVGDGQTTKESRFVGHDVPVAPVVKAVYANGTTTLSWLPVTESVEGGYIDATGITYKVVRTTDGKVVAERLDGTTCTDEVGEVEQLTALRYEVTADDRVKQSLPGQSPRLIAGVAQLPYNQTFETEDSFRYITCIDVNDDDKTWEWSDMYGGAAKLRYTAMWPSDDWMILPGMRLEGGKSYILSFRPYGGDSYKTEKYEVKYGTAAVGERMTETILPETEMNTNNAKSEIVECYITPAETGVYYIGFHGMSEKLAFNVYIDDISVSAGLTVGSPKAVADFKVVPAMDGVRAATLTFTAPTETMNGEPLRSLSKIEVLRDGSLLTTLTDVAPGEEVSVTDDSDLAIGTHEWSVMAYNGTEVSPAVSATAHIGFELARAVTNVKAVEGPEDGYVTVTWDPVTEDLLGNRLPEGAVTYTVYERHDFDNPLAVGITDTKINCKVVLPEGVQQAFRQFMVVPVTEAGENYDGDMSVAIPVGKPFGYPYIESFPNQDASYPLGLMTDDGDMMRWGVYDSGYFLDSNGDPINVYDNDGGMAVFFGMDPGCAADMLTPKIQLPAENPELSFHFYPMADNDLNELHVYVKCDGEEKEVGHVVMSSTGPRLTWNRTAMQLTEYAGKVVSLRFRGVVRTHTRLFMDRVMVNRGADYDLALTSIKAPATARPGNEFEVELGIANYGAKSVESYTVDLLCNGVEVAQCKGTPIERGEKLTIKLAATLNALDAEENLFYAAINLDEDENYDNNVSPDAYVTLRNNPYPPVTGLRGEYAETGGIALEWNEPDLNDLTYEPEEETFESGEDWKFGFGDWTFIDMDGGVMGAFDSAQIPDMTPADTETNFFVFNCTGANFPETWDAHSGVKYLACIYNYEEVQNDDWAISPRLTGEAQEVTLYAKSYHYQYLEDFEVLYTTEDFDAKNFDPSKFISVGKKMQIEATWKPYSFQLPAGARYFAIRCISNDAMMLMVDDVTFCPYAGADAIAHMGYNVYRDGERVNAGFVEEPTYVDAVNDDRDHTYHVTAVYDLGESVAAQILVAGSSVEQLAAEGITVEVLRGAIAISGAEGRRIVVVDMEGKVVFAGIAAERTVVPVAAGIYAITAGGDARKVNIR